MGSGRTRDTRDAWGPSLNRDPRHRGVAGLGLEVGIRSQEELVSDVLAHLGALHEARQRVRHLVMGWPRPGRCGSAACPPTRPDACGCSVRRCPGWPRTTASIGDLATADDRTLARGTFSAAARRVLRSGPARTKLAAPAATAAAVLEAANRLPPTAALNNRRPPAGPGRHARTSTVRARQAVDTGQVATAALLAAAADLAKASDDRMRPLASQMVIAMRQAVQAGRAVPWGQALATLASSDADVVGRGRAPVNMVRMLSGELGNLRDRFAEPSR